MFIIKMAVDQKNLQNVLDKALKPNLSNAEQGEIYANFARLYLEAVNEINREYEVILDGAIKAIENLNAQERELAQNLAIAKAKAELRS